MTPRALHAPARLAGLPLLRTQTDERLVDLVRAGNDGAFEAIVARYRRSLLRYCSGLLPEARAEDAVQQTFLRAYDGLRASGAEMALRPWLYRIAHNVALNALRDRSLRYEELSDGIDGVERPDQAYEQSERLHDTVAAVGALPQRQRDAMVLRELEGRSYEEIAAELGVTGGAVRQLLNRARGTLRAGVTAVTPFGLMARMPLDTPGGPEMGTRIAELCAAGAAGAVVSKACATVLVTGAVVGGVASAPSGGTDEGRASERPRQADSDAGERDRGAARLNLQGAADVSRRNRGRSAGDRSGRSGRDGDRSGPGGGSDDSTSGPGGSGSDDGSASSGPGSSGSGSGVSGSGSSGSGGSGSTGSGSSGSGSDSSGSSGSGSSGSSGTSGSGSSGSGGSGSSGSGSSGSGSSGSGSGRSLLED